jgi:hypothetical protein
MARFPVIVMFPSGRAPPGSHKQCVVLGHKTIKGTKCRFCAWAHKQPISVLIMELWGALGLRTLPAAHPAESEMAAIATVVVMTRKFYTVFSPAPS